jgi:hypothetical protein
MFVHLPSKNLMPSRTMFYGLLYDCLPKKTALHKPFMQLERLVEMVLRVA